ncbi:MAG: hypothetical protein A2W86_01205 [Bacteroidetes bacterium GWD2_45_23]|nr:MAG: hypothetical protein A2W87_11010 [Bacteroidetes bacterium GWC2_46_850]OFX84107.1 MAG: hypothetical protein A2W86_01205 [Bacteroidetes bacterium GWD2_45_23]
MQLHKIIITLLAAVLLLNSCDDQVMEWKTPEGHNPVTASEIPLNLAEKIANYDFIKAYVPSGMIVGIGAGADLYINDPKYKEVIDKNFQLFTPGNAMKHSSVVRNNGTLDFTTIDALFNTLPADMKILGHNLLWHTQQRQAYLKSLIAPEVVIVTDPGDKLENIILNSDFEAGNTSGWGAWSSAGASQKIAGPGKGYNSSYAMLLNNPKEGANYSAQAYYTLPATTWEEGETYIVSFYVYSEEGNPGFQIQLQNRTSYSGGGYTAQSVPAKQWYYFEAEIAMTAALVNLPISHITIDFGAGAGDYYIDDFKFGKKKTGPVNHVPNGSFEKGLEGWNANNPGAGIEAVSLPDAPAGSQAVKMIAGSGASKAWDLQMASPEIPAFPGEKVRLSFFVKADQTGKGRISFSGLTNGYPWMNWTGSQSGWTEAFEVGTAWQQISVVLQDFNTDFAEGVAVWKCNFDFGYLPDVTYYIDDVTVTIEEPEAPAPAAASTMGTRAGGITYVYKTEIEKKAALLGAMEAWIKGIVQHSGDRIYGWDVINEPIADNNQWRGIGGNFMNEDSHPVENEGLELNWADDHFYWGYYIGKEYAVKAFEYARKYAPQGTVLFVNDYNLESNPSKLDALIDFVAYIEQNGQTVDGIGTQMHVSADTTAAFNTKVDNMFKKMAATGKIVRVTELDVRLGTASPSAGQLEMQAKTYRQIAESYIKHVPQAQRSGITIWTLTDHPREHEYWLPDESPNLFDKDFNRKHAYKGFCDGLAGRDISEDFTGDDYVNVYTEE